MILNSLDLTFSLKNKNKKILKSKESLRRFFFSLQAHRKGRKEKNNNYTILKGNQTMTHNPPDDRLWVRPSELGLSWDPPYCFASSQESSELDIALWPLATS